MLANELYKNTNKNYVFKILYVLNNHNGLDIDWELFFEYFNLNDIRNREFQLEINQNTYNKKERGLSLMHIINNYDKEDLKKFLNIMIKKCRDKEIELFIKNEIHLIDSKIELKLFKKIVSYLNDLSVKKIMNNLLTNEQVEFLINERNLSLVFFPRKERINIKSLYFYIMNGGRISQRGFICFLTKIHSRVYGFSEKGFSSKKILTTSFNKILKSSYLNFLIDKRNSEIEKKIDASLVLFFDVKKPDKNILKFKEEYNKKHNILINKIFHDIYSFEKDDQLVKKDNYTFKKYFNHKPLVKLIYEKTIDEYYISPYFYRSLFSLKRMIPELDEQWFYALKDYDIDDLKFIYEYEEGLLNVSKLLLELGFSKRKVFNILTKKLNEENRNKVDNGFLNDIVSMYNNLKAMSWTGRIKGKYKNVVLIHDFLNIEIRKQSQENYYLNQDEIEHIDGQEFEEGLFISVPLTNHELIEVGALLNHCVGNGTYSSKVLNKESNIITFKDKENYLLGCVEFANGKVIQSKGYSNSNYKFNHVKFFKLIESSKN